MDLLSQLHLFTIFSPITIMILVGCSVLVWRNRKKSATLVTLFWFLICSMGILLFNTLELISRTEFLTVLMARIMFVFFSGVSVLWLLFALQYTGRHRLVTRTNVILLSVIPILYLAILFTNEFHHTFWEQMTFIKSGPYLLLKVKHGFSFFISASYSYILMMLGVVLIFNEYRKNFRLHRRQALLVVLGAVIPVLFNVIYLGKLIPGLVKDYTPFSFFLSGLLFTITLFKYRLRDLIPLARTTIVEQLSDGIIVLDNDGRILDINPAAQNITGLKEDAIGQIFTVFEFMWNDFYKSIPLQNLLSDPEQGLSSTSSQIELTKREKHETLYYQREISPIYRDNKLSGHIISLKNITEQTRLLKKVERLAAIDDLTGLLNRRTFMNHCNKILQECAELEKPVSYAILDLDDFKEINDKYGHITGDQVLRKVAEVIQNNIREIDFAGRFGGDEFTVIFPGCNKEQAQISCGRLRKRIEELGKDFSETLSHMPVRTSIGVYTTQSPADETTESLLNHADKALYKAKTNGRNQISQG